MMKKLGIVVMTAFFSVSVAGLSFADEMKEHKGMPATTGAPANPCDPSKDKKPVKKAAKKKAAAPKEDAKPAAPAKAPESEKK